jgi:hypothetical protein
MQKKEANCLAVAAGSPVLLMKPHTGCNTAEIMLGSAMLALHKELCGYQDMAQYFKKRERTRCYAA